jgi:hypothetical protein
MPALWRDIYTMKAKCNLKLDWCSYNAAKYAVEHWHYSKRMPVAKLVKIGVWEDGLFIGVVIFGAGATGALVKSYGLTNIQGCELVRIALTSHINHVSRIISIAVKLLKAQSPGIQLIVSFADTNQDHTGGVYQAAGWLYTGLSSSADEYIYRNKRWHGRSFRASHPGKEHSAGVEIVPGSRKHRYLFPMNQEIRSRIEKLRQPYPKRARSDTSDTAAIHAAEGGAAPTLALTENREVA